MVSGGATAEHGGAAQDHRQAIGAHGRELFLHRQYNQELVVASNTAGGTLLGALPATSPSPVVADGFQCSSEQILQLAALAFTAANRCRRHRTEFFLRHGRLVQAVRFILRTALTLSLSLNVKLYSPSLEHKP